MDNDLPVLATMEEVLSVLKESKEWKAPDIVSDGIDRSTEKAVDDAWERNKI